MLENKYLYGTDDVPEIPAHVIMRRIELLDDELTDILEAHYTKRDLKRKRAIEKAIKFWEDISER